MGSTTSHQFEIRKKEYKRDLKRFDITENEAQKLRVSDFNFERVPFDDKDRKQKCKEFIKRYEWLGTVAQRNTDYFGAYYKGMLSGVVIMSVPNMFSKVLGEGTHKIEKLISRGACAAFTPKNLASSFIKWSINKMVKETPFRVFGAYCDIEANELGSIYQAANFIYLGDRFGGQTQLYCPKTPQKGWFSDREIRKVSAYKRFARDLGIIWQRDWLYNERVMWDRIPEGVEQRIRKASREFKQSCIVRKLPLKHKYIFIEGQSKREKKELLKRFYERNPKLMPKGPKDRHGLPYPKIRGN